MEYIECPTECKLGNKINIFLAGGITHCPDWQRLAIKSLGNTKAVRIFNPRRADFDMQNENGLEEQISWEFRYMQLAEIIIFYFPKESVCPIALYELGRYNAIKHGNEECKPKKLFICVHPDYPRRRDIEIQTRLTDECETVYTDFDEMMQAVRNYTQGLGEKKRLQQ